MIDMITDNKIMFSIIIPVYNAEKYLDKCIQSILQQSYANWEIILVDDGSVDGSGKICDIYAQKDGRITVMHQENAGQSSARNAGLAKATGSHVLFVDGDDYLELNALEILESYLRGEDTDMLWFNAYRVYHDHKEEFLKLRLPKDFSDFLDDFLEKNKGMYCAVWDKVYKASILKDIKFKQGIKYEDSFIFPEIFSKCTKVRVIEDHLYNYFQENKTSITHLIAKDPKDDYYFFCVYKEWCQYLQSSDKSLYEILVASALEKAIKIYNIDLGTHCLGTKELQEVDNFLSENERYFNKLTLGKRVLCFGWKHCKLINQIKAIEYQLKYGQA